MKHDVLTHIMQAKWPPIGTIKRFCMVVLKCRLEGYLRIHIPVSAIYRIANH